MNMSYRVIPNDHLMRLDTRLDEADLAFFINWLKEPSTALLATISV